jgi:hypothetical protein
MSSRGFRDLTHDVGVLFLFKGAVIVDPTVVAVEGNRIKIRRTDALIEGFSSAFIATSRPGLLDTNVESRLLSRPFIVTCDHCLNSDDAFSPATSCVVVFPPLPRTSACRIFAFDLNDKNIVERDPLNDLAIFRLTRERADGLTGLDLTYGHDYVPRLGQPVSFVGYMRFSFTQVAKGRYFYISAFELGRGGAVLKSGDIAHETMTTIGRETYFLVDATGRGGMSGAPVFSTLTNLAPGSLCVVGVYRGRQWPTVRSLNTALRRQSLGEQLDIALDVALDKDASTEIGRVVPISLVANLVRRNLFGANVAAEAVDNSAASSSSSVVSVANRSTPSRPIALPPNQRETEVDGGLALVGAEGERKNKRKSATGGKQSVDVKRKPVRDDED